MLTVEEALARCMTLQIPRRTEHVPLHAALHRVLAEDVAAAHTLPHWDNAAMDGYAIRFADCSASLTDAPQAGCDNTDAALPPAVAVLTVTETIAAGTVGARTIGPGQAARIMTGAPVPVGADTVVMRENTAVTDERVTIHGMPREGQHIRYAGEEARPGAPLLSAGDTLTPGKLGLLAAQGHATAHVVARPRVGIISTGDEVRAPGEDLQPGQIWSSNTAALIGLIIEAGAEPIDCGIAPDTLEGTRDTFLRAIDTGCDLLVSTGGVSVGDFDVVKDAMGSLGAEMLFWKVRAKPGKPLALGQIGGVPTFGLPGNPVSCMVNFLQFVRPVLRRAMGDPRPFLPVLRATIDAPFRKRHGRAEFVRVRLRVQDGRLRATPTGNQSSGWITSMAHGDALLIVGIESTGVDAGDEVWVQPMHASPALMTAEPAYPW